MRGFCWFLISYKYIKRSHHSPKRPPFWLYILVNTQTVIYQKIKGNTNDDCVRRSVKSARAHQYTILIYLYFHEHKTLSPSSRKKKGNSITVHIPPPPNNKICDVAVLSRSLPVIGDVNLALMGRARARAQRRKHQLFNKRAVAVTSRKSELIANLAVPQKRADLFQSA